jgi:hypothetical protein
MVGGLRDDSHSVDVDTYADVPSYEETASAADAIMRRFPIMEEGLAQRGHPPR